MKLVIFIRYGLEHAHRCKHEKDLFGKSLKALHKVGKLYRQVQTPTYYPKNFFQTTI